MFWAARGGVLFFFDIGGYLADSCFGMAPRVGPPGISVLGGSAWVPVCFDVSGCLTNKCFDIVWGCRSPWDPRGSIFERLGLGCRCFVVSGGV